MRWEIEDTPEQAEFRAEFRTWLREELAPGWMQAIDAGDDDGFERIRADSAFNPFGWTGKIGSSRFAAPSVAQGIWRTLRRAVDGARDPVRTRPIQASDRLDKPSRRRARRAHHHRARNGGSKGAIPEEDPLGRRDLVPALQRTRFGLGSGIALHPGSTRRRRVDRERPEGLDIDRAVLGVRNAARA